MAADNLDNGDVVDIYGNGMIAESYPHSIMESQRSGGQSSKSWNTSDSMDIILMNFL